MISYYTTTTNKNTTLIEVHPYTEIKNKISLTLDNITHFENIDAKIIEKMSHTELDDAPHFGEKRIFSNLALGEIFRNFSEDIKSKAKGLNVHLPTQMVVENRNNKLDDNRTHETLIKK